MTEREADWTGTSLAAGRGAATVKVSADFCFAPAGAAGYACPA